jgi:hypothetical protein
MLMETNSSSETTSGAGITTTKKLRTIRVSIGGAAVLGLMVAGFVYFSVEGLGFKASFGGRWYSQPAQTTDATELQETLDGVAKRIRRQFEAELKPADPHPNIPVETAPLPALPLFAQGDVPLPRPREKRNWYAHVIQEGDDGEFLRIYECGRDGWPKDCDLETEAERLEAARDRYIYPKDK